MRLQTSERVGARSKEAARLVVVAGFWEANQTFAWSDQVSLTPRTAVSVDDRRRRHVRAGSRGMHGQMACVHR